MRSGDFSDKLIGHRVVRIAVDAGENTLYLEREHAGVVAVATHSECCSESWWADAIGVKQLLGAIVTRGGWIDMPRPEDDRSRQDIDEAYGLRLETDRGVCEFVFRNSSNGYYGGDAEVKWATDIPEGARTLTEDWRA